MFKVILLKLQNRQSLHPYKYLNELFQFIVHNKTKIKKNRITLQAKKRNKQKLLTYFSLSFSVVLRNKLSLDSKCWMKSSFLIDAALIVESTLELFVGHGFKICREVTK